MAKRTQLSTTSRRRLYEIEQTGEAIAEELYRHIHACNEKANKKQGLPLTTRNMSMHWSKQEKAYYGALKNMQRLWEGRNPGWEIEDPVLAEKLAALLEVIGGGVIGSATDGWDMRTQQRNMDACRWDKVKPNEEIGYRQSRRMACRVVRAAS